MATVPVKYNVGQWIKDNEAQFLPPVCNKMMHNEGQMKAFYVGGPNQRKDYHIEEGEELFYMLKGDMCLKIVEKGKHKDVPIKEGEIFLLPGKIAHSPQRQADTIGMVLERERAKSELDGLRYFVEDNGVPTLNSLYEKWFYCDDLGTQLGPVIKGFFASEQCKTGKPIPGTIPENPPIILNSELEVRMPFNLHDYIKKNKEKLNNEHRISPFGDGHQIQVDLIGEGQSTGCCDVAETFVWQIEGTSTYTIGGTEYNLGQDDSLLIPCAQSYTVSGAPDSVALFTYQDPTRK